jgi:hypothetical protein
VSIAFLSYFYYRTLCVRLQVEPVPHETWTGMDTSAQSMRVEMMEFTLRSHGRHQEVQKTRYTPQTPVPDAW